MTTSKYRTHDVVSVTTVSTRHDRQCQDVWAPKKTQTLTMLSVNRTGAARASLVVLSFFALAVHSFIPAQPSNDTDAIASLLDATLNIFWFDQGQLTLESARAVATSDNVATASYPSDIESQER